MSREELIELICPFENHLKCKDDDYSISCDECKEELDEMLDEYDAEVRAEVFDHIEKYMLTSICSPCNQEACEGGMAESIQECETIRFLKNAIHDAIAEMKEIKT